MKVVILLLLAAIIVSLGLGLFHLVRGSDSKKMVNALTVRIVLSVLLFATLFAAWITGALQPQGLG